MIHSFFPPFLYKYWQLKKRNILLPRKWLCSPKNCSILVICYQHAGIGLSHVFIQFGLRHPELRQLFNKLRYFYGWFVISRNIKIGDFHNKIKSNLSESFGFVRLQRHILVKKKSLPEIIKWCEKISEE